MCEEGLKFSDEGSGHCNKLRRPQWGVKSIFDLKSPMVLQVMENITDVRERRERKGMKPGRDRELGEEARWLRAVGSSWAGSLPSCDGRGQRC